MKWIAATKNEKKRVELVRILEPLGITLLTEQDLQEPLPEVEEIGTTFAENAMLKAVSAMRHTGLCAIADDSGLCVDALDGAPGVHSARYAGEGHDDEANNNKLLSALKDVQDQERTARYVCAVCCALPDGRLIQAQGIMEGKIGFSRAGTGGFGYDPLFVVDGRTVAEMTPEEKDTLSHRGKALRALQEAIRKELSYADQ